MLDYDVFYWCSFAGMMSGIIVFIFAMINASQLGWFNWKFPFLAAIALVAGSFLIGEYSVKFVEIGPGQYAEVNQVIETYPEIEPLVRSFFADGHITIGEWVEISDAAGKTKKVKDLEVQKGILGNSLETTE